MNQTVLEVVRQFWRSEDSHRPFAQPLGFSWELRDDGLYAWQVNKDTDETTVYTRHSFRMDQRHLKPLLKFIRDVHHVSTDDEAVQILLSHLRHRQGQPGPGRLLAFLMLLMLLTFLCIFALVGYHVQVLRAEPPIAWLFIHGFAIALPLMLILYLLICNPARAREKASRQLTYQNEEQYLRALHTHKLRMLDVEANRLIGVNWLLIALLALWLIAAVVLVFIP